MTKKLVLIVVDGMTPPAFERAVESGRAPALSFLAEHGDYRQATSVFPSLTPELQSVFREVGSSFCRYDNRHAGDH